MTAQAYLKYDNRIGGVKPRPKKFKLTHYPNGFESEKRAARAAEFQERREDRDIERHLGAVALNKKRLEHQEIRILAASAALFRHSEGQPADLARKKAA